jgi:hypothetical protein
VFLAASCLFTSVLARRAWGDSVVPVRAVPLSLAIAVDVGVAVTDAAWIDSQIAAMAALYVPLGLQPVVTAVRPMASSFVHMETRSDRDALAKELRPGVANVFVVGTLRDVDEPDRMRRGVHWRNRANPSLRYVILASEAMPPVLAHEMGHYFGLFHSSVVDNLMSYEHTGRPAFLDAAQARTIQANAREAFRTGEIIPPPSP